MFNHAKVKWEEGEKKVPPDRTVFLHFRTFQRVFLFWPTSPPLCDQTELVRVISFYIIKVAFLFCCCFLLFHFSVFPHVKAGRCVDRNTFGLLVFFFAEFSTFLHPEIEMSA